MSLFRYSARRIVIVCVASSASFFKVNQMANLLPFRSRQKRRFAVRGKINRELVNPAPALPGSHSITCDAQLDGKIDQKTLNVDDKKQFIFISFRYDDIYLPRLECSTRNSLWIRFYFYREILELRRLQSMISEDV
jgi:hypothetical protein